MAFLAQLLKPLLKIGFDNFSSETAIFGQLLRLAFWSRTVFRSGHFEALLKSVV